MTLHLRIDVMFFENLSYVSMQYFQFCMFMFNGIDLFFPNVYEML